MISHPTATCSKSRIIYSVLQGLLLLWCSVLLTTLSWQFLTVVHNELPIINAFLVSMRTDLISANGRLNATLHAVCAFLPPTSPACQALPMR
jgi:hypothetical protein